MNQVTSSRPCVQARLIHTWTRAYTGLGLHPADAATFGSLTAAVLLTLASLPSRLWRRLFPDATTWGDVAEIAVEGLLLLAVSPVLLVAVPVVVLHLAWVSAWELLARRPATGVPVTETLPIALPAGPLAREDGIPVAMPVAEPVRLLAYTPAPVAEQTGIPVCDTPARRRTRKPAAATTPSPAAKAKAPRAKPAGKPRSTRKAMPMPAAARVTDDTDDTDAILAAADAAIAEAEAATAELEAEIALAEAALEQSRRRKTDGGRHVGLDRAGPQRNRPKYGRLGHHYSTSPTTAAGSGGSSSASR